MKFLLLLFAVLFVGLATAQQPGIVNQRCNLFDSNGYPTAEAMRKHAPYVLGMNQPGTILHLNSTVMHNHQPGTTTFEDDSHSHIYQVNGFEMSGTGCAWTHHQFYKRTDGWWVYSKWVDEINDDQRATQQFPGSGMEPLLNSYNIRPIEPIVFEHMGATVLKFRSRNLSAFSYVASYNYELPDGTELNIMDETVAVTPKTLALLQQGIISKEFYYSLNLYSDVHNGFVDWGFIFRPEKPCEGATGDVAESCECYQRMLNGELTLENDPLAAASGYYHEVWTCRLEQAEAKRSVETAAPEVKWPSYPLALASYDLAYTFNSVYNDHPLRYVEGMPVSREEHNHKFFEE